MQCFERCRNLVGIVGEVVNNGYLICSSDNFQSPADAAELTEMGHCLREAHAACLRDAQRGEGVGSHYASPGTFSVTSAASPESRALTRNAMPVGDWTGAEARRSAGAARKL